MSLSNDQSTIDKQVKLDFAECIDVDQIAKKRKKAKINGGGESDIVPSFYLASKHACVNSKTLHNEEEI